MGSKSGKEGGERRDDTGARAKVGKDDFEMISTIGEGNYAKVLLVKKNDTGEFYAMKILNKDVLIERDEVKHTITERKILEGSSHPFLVKMHYAFQTADRLYIIMNFANGGELFSHLKREKRFPEERAKFYSAEICLGLEYLHDMGVVYRDLKPENVLLDAEGHIVLTDFGLSKILKGDKTKTFCGTPEYLAPETILNKGHGKPVDWWSFGTLLYEMLVGIPPFYSQDVHQMYDMILHYELFIPEYVGLDGADLLSKLLIRDPNRRLGSGPDGAREVKGHPFFKNMDWEALAAKQIEPTFKPTVQGAGDLGNIEEEFTKKKPPTDTPVDSSGALGSIEQRQFEGFTFEPGSGNQLAKDSPDLRAGHSLGGAPGAASGSLASPSP